MSSQIVKAVTEDSASANRRDRKSRSKNKPDSGLGIDQTVKRRGGGGETGTEAGSSGDEEVTGEE